MLLSFHSHAVLLFLYTPGIPWVSSDFTAVLLYLPVASLWLQTGAAMHTNVSELVSLASTTVTQGAAQNRDLEGSSKADISNTAKELLFAFGFSGVLHGLKNTESQVICK